MDLGPCCPQSTKGVRYITIGGSSIGITGLPEIIQGVKSLGLIDEEKIKQELYTRVKIRNYIPSSRVEEYKTALYDVYQKFEPEEETQ